MKPLPYHKAVEKWHETHPNTQPWQCVNPSDDERFTELVGGLFIPSPERPILNEIGNSDLYWISGETPTACFKEYILAEEDYPGEFYK